jgi:16S rRNA (cytidine1402-2'-O)-methyltransferase
MPRENLTHKTNGRLYVVATPIGNLEDISFRALRVLKEASIIACEDTRQTIKLLNKYNIKNRLLSYFHPREQQKVPKIIDLLKKGNDVALVSDAGTPGIADPGYPLIREAIAQGISITPVPGPSAITTALSAAGMTTHKFLFQGFPPSKKEAVRKLLASLKTEAATLIFYLPSRKLSFFLATIQNTLGERKIVIAREMTKIHEEFIRGSPTELLRILEKKPLKGELTLLVEGRPKKSPEI